MLATARSDEKDVHGAFFPRVFAFAAFMIQSLDFRQGTIGHGNHMSTGIRIDPLTGEIIEEGAEPAPPANVVEYSVSDISFAIKRTMEDTFGFVRVRGEVGRVSRPASGHVYLDLKDERAVLAAVMWKGTAARQKFQPEQGMEVVATGRITTYPGQSKYQLVIEKLEPAGLGALMALLEERRKKLAAEGLFDESRKKPLPWLPEVIGVVTSPTGAVIRDILHRLADRFRGGGSVEDLWGFNDEIVVRAAAASDIPLISAVGHETDWTLIDHAADWRAPTPTAAAEKAVPVRAELLAWVGELGTRLLRAMTTGMEQRRHRVVAASRALPRPDDVLALARQRLDAAASRLDAALRSLVERRLIRAASRLVPLTLERRIRDGGRAVNELHRRLVLAMRTDGQRRRQRLDTASRMLESLSYRAVLSRGYAVVRHAETRTPLTRKAMVAPGMQLAIEFADGETRATAEGGGTPVGAGSRRRKRKDPDDGQGSLF